jgi:hypothetical protein
MVDAGDLPIGPLRATMRRLAVQQGSHSSARGASAPPRASACATKALAVLGMLLGVAACEGPPKSSTSPPTGGPLQPSGCALQVPERGAHLSVVDTSDLFPESLTLELWASFDDIPRSGGGDAANANPQRILSAENLADDTGFYVEVDFANYRELICAVRRGDVWWTAGYPVSELEEPGWRHLACVLDDAGLSMWFNGIGVSTSPIPESFPTPAYVHDESPLVLGGADAHSPRVARPMSAFLGALDEVRFSRGALYRVRSSDAGSVLDADAFAPEARPEVSNSTLALWHFDECAGEVARDSTERARNGSLEGGATWRAAETPDAKAAGP